MHFGQFVEAAVDRGHFLARAQESFGVVQALISYILGRLDAGLRLDARRVPGLHERKGFFRVLGRLQGLQVVVEGVAVRIERLHGGLGRGQVCVLGKDYPRLAKYAARGARLTDTD